MICPKCGNENGKIDSHNGSYCKSCDNVACKKSNMGDCRKKNISDINRLKRYAVRDYILSKKIDKSCLDCGTPYPWFILDFDHVRGIKRGNLSLAPSKHWSLAAIDEEIAKCDLICSNCHRIRTFSKIILRGCGPTDKTQSYEL